MNFFLFWLVLIDFRLYFFLEKDEIVDTRKDRKKKTPYHLKPTATLLMKNRELNRIVDNKKRFTEKVETLKYHYAKSRAEKQHLSNFNSF